MTDARLQIYTGSLTVVVVALALLNWNFAPDHANSWVAALIFMPVIWLLVSLKMKFIKRAGQSDMERKFFASAVIFAGLLIAVSLATKLIGNLYNIDTDVIKRVREVFIGFVLLYFGNMLPKIIGPSLAGKCSNTAAKSVQRFTGWALVLGALGYIGAWLFVPISQASTIAHWCVGAMVVLVILRILYATLRERRVDI